jgi:hypothetical protein
MATGSARLAYPIGPVELESHKTSYPADMVVDAVRSRSSGDSEKHKDARRPGAHEDWGVAALSKSGQCNSLLWSRAGEQNSRRLEYIAVLGSTRLLERGHGERLADPMDQFPPDWRTRRDGLNELPLAEETWT